MQPIDQKLQIKFLIAKLYKIVLNNCPTLIFLRIRGQEKSLLKTVKVFIEF